MKKRNILFAVIVSLIAIASTTVFATSVLPGGGGFVPPAPLPMPLFTICDKTGGNCMTINEENINTNKTYDNFEIRDREIYLNNNEITLKFAGILTYNKIHITGTNKITNLNSISPRDPVLDQEEPYLYASDYIPFTVEGDGTLEIEKSNLIKKNTSGERYYKCWKFYTVGSLSSGRCLTEVSIDEANDTVTFDVPKTGYTASDLKSIFGNSADSFYITELGYTMSTAEFSEFPPEMLKDIEKPSALSTFEQRTQIITTLIDNASSSPKESGMHYLSPTVLVFEEAQITPAWGETNIVTTLNRSFSDSGSYLIGFPEEVNEPELITTTQKENIVFVSEEGFDPNYHLRVDDITEKITDVQALNVQAKTEKVLVELYDINMYDQDDNIVKMENGTYTIKVKIDDLLKKYKDYEVIYISDDNKVELINAKVESEYIVFNTTHLSKYGIVGKEVKPLGNIVNPNTADSVVTYGLILASLAVATALVLLRIKKLKKSSN